MALLLTEQVPSFGEPPVFRVGSRCFRVLTEACVALPYRVSSSMPQSVDMRSQLLRTQRQLEEALHDALSSREEINRRKQYGEELLLRLRRLQVRVRALGVYCRMSVVGSDGGSRDACKRAPRASAGMML